MKTLADINLSVGGHSADSGELGAMEAVAWYMDEMHSDKPQCTSPTIAAAMRTFNDWLPDEDRNAVLKPLLLEVIGTNTTLDDEITRAKIAADYAQQFSAIAQKHVTDSPATWAARAAEWAAEWAAARAAKSALAAAEWAAKWAAKSAEWAAKSAVPVTAESEVYPLIGMMIMDMCEVGK